MAKAHPGRRRQRAPGTAPAAPRPDLPRLSLDFLKSAPGPAECPPADRPEIAVAGRSNAGKSSVLNRLSGSRQTAKVSKTPGRTQLLNFFALGDGGRLVDLPGYGYAAASRQAQTGWQQGVNAYLSSRECLVALILVMDIRHPLQGFDQELIDWALASELPLLILLNKADKLGQSARQQTLRQVRATLPESSWLQVSLYSALKGYGQQDLLDWIAQQLAEAESEVFPAVPAAADGGATDTDS